MFQTGFAYEITGTEHNSLPLLGKNLEPDIIYWSGMINGQDASGAQWLSQYDSAKRSNVYSGYTYPLIGYGPLNVPENLYLLSNDTQPATGDFVYLATINTRYGLIFAGGGVEWNTYNVQRPILPHSNSIYSNGDCEISVITPNS